MKRILPQKKDTAVPRERVNNLHRYWLRFGEKVTTHQPAHTARHRCLGGVPGADFRQSGSTIAVWLRSAEKWYLCEALKHCFS